MLVYLQFFLIVLALATTVHWLIPGTRPGLRAWWLLAVSVVLVSAVAPVGGLFVVATGVFCYLMARLFVHYRNRWTLMLGCIGVLTPLLVSRLLFESDSMLITLGIAFTTVRALSLIVDAYARPQVRHLRDIQLYLLFFPLYTVGPIDRFEKFAGDKLSMSFSLSDVALGVLRLARGIFIGLFVADGLITAMLGARFPDVGEGLDQLTTSGAWEYVILRFLYSFTNFVAVSEIAIGASRMLGFRIVENFDMPLLAANIQDFWRRYHISMGFFITRYLYFPIVGLIRRKWATYVATFTAFVLFGLWHAFTWNYLLWGVGHGVAMAGYHAYRQTVVDRNMLARVRALPPVRILATTVTLLYVAWLQTFANMPALEDAVTLTRRMLAM